MPPLLIDLLFILASAVAVAGGLFAVTRRNAVYSVIGLIVVFIALGGIFALLDAIFLAVGQVMVYAGAILMLFLFVVMLFDLGRARDESAAARARDPLYNPRALVLTAILFVFLVLPVLMAGESWDSFEVNNEQSRSARVQPPVTIAIEDAGGQEAALLDEYGTPTRVGFDMFDRYLVPFEIVGLVLLAGIVGAVVLARRRHRPHVEDEALLDEDGQPIEPPPPADA